MTRIVGGEAGSVDLCLRCAGLPGAAGLLELLSGLLDAVVAGEGPRPDQPGCPGCGLTFEAFARSQRLGCERCYEAFSERLEPLLAQLQPTTRHAGKIPKRAWRSLRAVREAERLRARLEDAIRTERFEHAVELRDRLRALDAEHGWSEP